MPSRHDRSRRLTTFGLAAGLLVGAAAFPLAGGRAEAPDPAALSPALADAIRRLEHLAGRPMPALEGRIVIVSFFASWCAPCIDEFAYLGGVYDAYGGSDPVVVAINLYETWAGGDYAARLARFIDRTAPPFTVVRGDQRIAEAFGGVREIPSLFVFGRDGGLAYRFRNSAENAISETTEAQLHAVLSRLL